MRLQVSNVNDWMNHLAKAIRDENIDYIESLGNISDDWLQCHEEHQAQQNLIKALYEIIDR